MIVMPLLNKIKLEYITLTLRIFCIFDHVKLLNHYL